MRVLLIAGGWSNEREVSLSGAELIGAALAENGHQVRLADPAIEFKALLSLAAESDFAFINLHGSPGEDGLIQMMLDQAGCPYQGAGPASSMLALSKAASKTVFEREGLPTPGWELLTRAGGMDAVRDFPFPAFLKPDTGGSSLGIVEVKDLAACEKACEKPFELDRAMLLETRVRGVELTCSVLGRTPLPLIMIRPRTSDFFDYESKYKPGASEEICPAPVDQETTRRAQDMALRAHDALKITGVSRADFILGQDGLYLLEVNTLPGMTPTSLLPQAAAEAGYGFGDLLEKLMELGLEERSGS